MTIRNVPVASYWVSAMMRIILYIPLTVREGTCLPEANDVLHLPEAVVYE